MPVSYRNGTATPPPTIHEQGRPAAAGGGQGAGEVGRWSARSPQEVIFTSERRSRTTSRSSARRKQPGPGKRHVGRLRGGAFSVMNALIPAAQRGCPVTVRPGGPGPAVVDREVSKALGRTRGSCP